MRGVRVAREEGRGQAPPLRRSRADLGHTLLLGLAVLLSGCRGCTSSRPPIHLNPNMDWQPKLEAQEESTFFYDGAGMRVPVEDTVAQGTLRDDSPYWTGKGPSEAWIDTIPVQADAALLARGEQRFGIFCSPCHGAQADGKGMLFQRAQVQSANLMEQRFRDMPVGQLFDEVSHGVGLMPAYGPFVPVADRWAILAYLRQLQAATPAPEPTTPSAPAPQTAEAPAPAPAISAPATASNAPPPPSGGTR